MNECEVFFGVRFALADLQAISSKTSMDTKPIGKTYAVPHYIARYRYYRNKLCNLLARTFFAHFLALNSRHSSFSISLISFHSFEMSGFPSFSFAMSTCYANV